MKNHVKVCLLFLLCISPFIQFPNNAGDSGIAIGDISDSPIEGISNTNIGTKPAPITYQSTSGGYLKKAWRTDRRGDSYGMYTSSIVDGAIKYYDYNQNEISLETFNTIQNKIGSPDGIYDENIALTGDNYVATTYLPTSSELEYNRCWTFWDQGASEGTNEFAYCQNWDYNTNSKIISSLTLGQTTDTRQVSKSDIEAILSESDSHGNPQAGGGGTRMTDNWMEDFLDTGIGWDNYLHLVFDVDIPVGTYTALSIGLEWCTAFYSDWVLAQSYLQTPAYIGATFTYSDGTTSSESATHTRYLPTWGSISFYCLATKINQLTSIDLYVGVTSNGVFDGALIRNGYIAIDKVELKTFTYGDFVSQAVYQIDAGLPYNELSEFGGVDLSDYAIRNKFADQVDFIEYKFKVEFPTAATTRQLEFVRQVNEGAKNIDQDWQTMQVVSYSTSSVEVTTTLTDRISIMQILSAMTHWSSQSQNYQIGIRVYSQVPVGYSASESKAKVDYFSSKIHLRDYSEGPAVSNLNYDRDDPSKITWTFTKQVYQKWGLIPQSIIFEDLPLDHTIISSTWSNSEGIKLDRKSVMMSITGALPADAVIITEAPNYLEQIRTFAIKEVMTKLAGMQTRILKIESATFLKESNVRLNVTCKDLDYLGTDAFLRYNLESTGEIKYTSLLPLCPDTDLRNYSLDVNLNQIETLEKGAKYDQFVFYINSNNPDEAGFLYLPASFEIRKNDIVNPAFEWGDTYINYTFETNATSEYSVLVVQYNWEWHPEDYMFETNAKNYTANLTSGAILLSNVSIDFPYIFDNIDRHRTYPNPTFTFYFNNTDLGIPYDVILDEVSVVPYFYYDEEPAKSRIIFNQTDFEPITIDPNTEISVPVNFNYTQCNQTFQRGIYRLHVKFHETSSEYNSTYFNATLLMDGDYHDIGDILNYTTYEGLTGEQVIEGNFTKNPDTSAIACYIMDNEGYGDGTFLTFDRHGIFYGNQESPQVTIISPKHSEAYSTSLIPINSRVYDPDFNTDNASLHLFNEIWDLGWIDYPGAGEYHLMNLNPFDLTTGRIYVEVLARDLTLNYAFATSSFYCESYKDAIVNTTQIQIGSVNAKSTIEKVPCNVFVNFSNYDLFTRRIQLGSDYTDATGLKIQRSPLDVYYPQNQPDLGMSPIGDITYWKFDYATQNDILTFSLNSPIVEWNADGEFSTSTRKVFGARIKRHTNLRTYTNVHIIGDFSSLNLQNIRVYVTEITGGANISITNNCSLKYGYFGRYNEYFRVNFTVPLIIKGTDYAFKVAIVEDVSMEIKNYASGFFIGIMIGAVGAGVIRELIRIMKRQPKPKGRNQILRTYLPAILIGVALGCVAGYFWLSG